MGQRHEGFVVGRRQTVSGVYIAHWEVSYFAVRQHRPHWPWPRQVRCRLVPRPGLDSVFEAAGVVLPAHWRHHRGLSFDVTADVTPLEDGSFGHAGWCRWHLQAEEWIDVRMRP